MCECVKCVNIYLYHYIIAIYSISNSHLYFSFKQRRNAFVYACSKYTNTIICIKIITNNYEKMIMIQWYIYEW